MNKLTIFLLLIVSTLHSQSTNWLWARAPINSNSLCEGESVATDLNGNVYLAGYSASDSLIFDSIMIINPNPLSSEMILAKYDMNGNVLWVKSSKALGFVHHQNKANSVTTDNNGNVYVVGSFDTQFIMFDTITISNIIGESSFVVKYDSSGNVQWAEAGTSGFVNSISTIYPTSICFDGDNSIYIGGSFLDTANFGTNAIISNGMYDIFIAKYDLNGNSLWSKNIGGNSSELCNSITADKNKNILITGVFLSSILVVGTDTLKDDTTYFNKADILLAKLDSNGNALWSHRAGGNFDDYGYGVATDNVGNVYMAGSFNSGEIIFGNDTFPNANGPLGGRGDFILAKYDSNGNFIWAISAGGTGEDKAFSICIDQNNMINISGAFDSDSIKFGNITLLKPTANCTVSICDPMFVVKVDNLGNVICCSALASGGDDINAIAVDNSGNVYVGGDFFANPFVVGNDSLNDNGIENFFVAKWMCNSIMQVNQINEFSEVKSYPNPFNNELIVKSENQKGIIEIVDVTGNIVLREKALNEFTNLDTSHLKSGFYVLHYRSNNRSENFKIIKI